MPYETDCDIKLRMEGEVIIDELRAKLLERIGDTGSLDRAAEELGLSKDDITKWLGTIKNAMGASAVSTRADGKVVLTEAGRALLSEFETRTRIARSQVQNLWKKPWVTADGIVVIEDQIVLIKRGREPFKGMHALPGGIVEYGETVEECVVREFEEETGLRTRVLDLVGVYSAADRDPRGHFITVAFNLQPIGGTLRGGDDAADAGLFPLDRLPQLAADHLRILTDALARRDRHRSRIEKSGP